MLGPSQVPHVQGHRLPMGWIKGAFQPGDSLEMLVVEPGHVGVKATMFRGTTYHPSHCPPGCETLGLSAY